MTREARIAQVLAGAPKSARETLRRAFSGAASPRAAIKGQCLLCVGFDRAAVRNCTGYSCPLWAYRPYQEGEEEHPHAPDDAMEADRGGR